jgi:hypothetical protein
MSHRQRGRRLLFGGEQEIQAAKNDIGQNETKNHAQSAWFYLLFDWQLRHRRLAKLSAGQATRYIMS